MPSAPRSTDLSCALFVRVPPPVLPAREQQAFRPHVPSALRCFWGVSILTELCRTQPSLLSPAVAHPGWLPHVELLPAGTRHLALSVDLITERSEENFRKEVELLGALTVVFSRVVLGRNPTRFFYLVPTRSVVAPWHRPELAVPCES